MSNSSYYSGQLGYKGIGVSCRFAGFGHLQPPQAGAPLLQLQLPVVQLQAPPGERSGLWARLHSIQERRPAQFPSLARRVRPLWQVLQVQLEVPGWPFLQFRGTVVVELPSDPPEHCTVAWCQPDWQSLSVMLDFVPWLWGSTDGNYRASHLGVEKICIQYTRAL